MCRLWEASHRGKQLQVIARVRLSVRLHCRPRDVPLSLQSRSRMLFTKLSSIRSPMSSTKDHLHIPLFTHLTRSVLVPTALDSRINAPHLALSKGRQ